MLTPPFAAGDDILTSGLAAVTPLAAFKFADQNSGQSSTTLVADADLNLTLAAGGVYVGSGMIVFAASTTADYKCTFTAPSGATGGWNPNPYVQANDAAYFIPSAAPGFLPFATTIVVGAEGTAQSQAFSVQFAVVMGATAGSLQWEFAQGNSDASNCNTRAGPFLLAWKIA
jgi:hypothetical protein